jgi:hypothetical protein
MSIIVIVLLVVGALFALSYFSRRRFGVLGLALCAGFLLSTMWAADVTPFIKKVGIDLLTPPLASVVAAVLILSPALLLMLAGPAYQKHGHHRIIGATAFALLATAFLLSPLGSSINMDGDAKEIYMFFINNRNIIITIAIAYALFDILTYKTPKKLK